MAKEPKKSAEPTQAPATAQGQENVTAPAAPAAPWAPTVAKVTGTALPAEEETTAAPEDTPPIAPPAEGEEAGNADAPADSATAPEASPAQDAPAAEEPKADLPAVQEEEVKAVEGEVVEMVTVTVPKAYKLRVDHFLEKDYPAGVQQMERAHAEHWWSKANGVTIYNPAAK